MSRIIDIGGSASWRASLRPATFREVMFHVEQGGVASGRRVALHEFPKRNVPFAEDMGRRARRFSIQGYIIVSPSVPDYIPQRDDLLEALEMDGPGPLVHPTLGEFDVMVEQYGYVESRLKGGFGQFDMVFIERGQPIVQDATDAPASQVKSAADKAGANAATFLNQNLGRSPSISLDQARAMMRVFAR
jgi:prophage DNA circulation protein